MVRRRHGWQLPAHTFQVVAITVFLLLGVAFYVFLAPFLWFRFLQLTALALYSPLAFAVFLLYIRSSAIDPADVGVFKPQTKLSSGFRVPLSDGSASITPPVEAGARHHQSPGLSNLSRSSSVVVAGDKKLERKSPSGEQGAFGQTKGRIQTLLGACCGLFCGWFVLDDSCKDESNLQRPFAAEEEEVLFCTLCNAEVRKFSKHCRSCDKCVDGFDHHCRWLNNCVGRKNYKTFVSLMATSLSLLVLEWGLGMAVFVRCFVDKRAIERQIVDKLGNGFSRGPFATIVAICTFVSLLASVPLGELFFFHLILIRKGITTYEYVVAMRVQNEQQNFSAEGGDVPSFPTSPSSSTATGGGLSGSSSIGLQYSRGGGGGWCTPPRVFVDDHDEVIPHLVAGQVPSTVDPDAAGNMPISRSSYQQKKGAVRISAWKLAKLNTDEAIRAAASARETSSTFRPVEHFEVGVGDGESYPSSGNVSDRSSVPADYSNSKQRLKNSSTSNVNSSSSNVRRPPPFTLRDELRIRHEPVESAGDQIRSSGGSSSRTLSPLAAESRYGLLFPSRGIRLPPKLSGNLMEAVPSQEVFLGDSSYQGDMPAHHHVTALSHSSADFSRAWSGPAASSDGYEASSGGESADNGDFLYRERVSTTDHGTSSVEERRKVAPVGNRSSGGHGVLTTGRTDGNRGTDYSVNHYQPGDRYRWIDSPASPSPSLSNDKPSSDHLPDKLSPSERTEASPGLQSSSQAPGNLVYSGTSIFYGGPMAPSPTESGGSQGLPPKPPVPFKTGSLNPAVGPGLKPSVRATFRSQSPVFAPRTMLPRSLLSSPKS